MLCLGMLLSACGGKDVSEAISDNTSSEVSAEESDAAGLDNFETAFRFIVTSDTHVSSAGCTTAQRMAKMFQTAYAYAQTQDYKTVDAFVVAGDLTDNGYEYQYKAFMAVVDKNMKDETTMITVMGNHGYYGGNQTTYQANIDEELDKHVIVNGYHFIGLSTRDGDSYPTESMTWLNNALEEAETDDPEKPIFTFQHHHIKDTVYVSSEWYTSYSTQFNAAYGKYSQVINFSGHSHGPINNPTSVYQGKYTLFGTGTLNYFEMTSGMTYGTIPPNSDQAAQYYIVEVGKDNSVRVLPYDILTDDFFKTPSQLDDAQKQLIYYIPSVTDSSTWLYTPAKRAADAKPYFKEGAKAEVSDVSDTMATVSFDQAVDDSCVYSYEIVCTPASGSELKFNYFSEYYFEPMPDSLEYTLSGLKSSTDYTLTIYPYDCFGNKGEGISTTFSTVKGKVYTYTSVNPVNFSGTFTDFDSLDQLTIAVNTYAYGGKIDGDVFVGDWCSATVEAAVHGELEDGKGYDGSKALAIWSNDKENHGVYVFATDKNNNSTEFADTSYLRVWVDFTGVDFRKANFGLLSLTGNLYTTDEGDGRTDQKFYYLAEGSTEWKTYTHGDDGCFGTAQSSSVANFKGWLAFPTNDFIYRSGTGTTTEASGVSFHYNEISGVYLFWDYDDSISTGSKFYLDEMSLVEDYTAFEEYTAE